MAGYLWVDNDLSTQGTQTTISGVGGFETPRGTKFEANFQRGSNGMSVKLFFKYVKAKFGFLGGRSFETRIKKLWELAEKAEKGGQVALSDRTIF